MADLIGSDKLIVVHEARETLASHGPVIKVRHETCLRANISTKNAVRLNNEAFIFYTVAAVWRS